jgi:DNA-binding NarL/FixJ family response regulator
VVERKRRAVLRGPSDLRVEPAESADAVVLSFPIPQLDWQQRLSKTEIEVTRDVLAGLTNAGIAAKRGTASRTIANQIASIFKKLGVHSRIELSLLVLTGQTPQRR